MPKQRVYELASELGLKSKDLIQRLQALGFNHITSHANSLTSAEISLIKEKLKSVSQDVGAVSSQVDHTRGYKWDVFISYRRREPVRSWVQEHFYKRLYEWLPEKMMREPTIFIDEQIETGAPWRDELCDALQTSRFLVSIWSPSYFRSVWCTAEWHTMLAREQQLALGAHSTPKGLIYPIVFDSRELFPATACAIQYRDFSSWNINFRGFEATEHYGRFVQEIQQVATELGALIPQAQPWQPDWPVQMPSPEPIQPIPLPRLR